MLIFLGDSVVAEDEQSVPPPLAVANQMEDAAASQPLQHCTPELFHHGGEEVERSILAALVTWRIRALASASQAGREPQPSQDACLPPEQGSRRQQRFAARSPGSAAARSDFRCRDG